MAVIEVPQWQGSSSLAARRLIDGARMLSEVLPPGPRLRAQLASSAGTTEGGVRNAGVLAGNLAAVRAVLARAGALTPVVAGGDCGVELAPVEAAIGRFGDRLAVAWLDAHGDLHTPASSPSGAFHGMVLRALLGDGPGTLSPERTLKPGQVVLAGVRALDPAEREFVRRHRIRLVGVDELAAASALADAVAGAGAEAVYVHVDLDVLDPGEFGAVGFPEPGGLTISRLAAVVRVLAGRFAVAGIGITEYQPRGPADRAKLAPLVQAVADAAAATPPGEVAQIEQHAGCTAPSASATPTATTTASPGIARPVRPDPSQRASGRGP